MTRTRKAQPMYRSADGDYLIPATTMRKMSNDAQASGWTFTWSDDQSTVEVTWEVNSDVETFILESTETP